MSIPEIVPLVEGDLIVHRLDKAAAKELDGRIRRLAGQVVDQLTQVRRLLDDAKAGLVHEALGFRSWPEYVADVLGGTLQLSNDDWREMVQLMADEGMSQRAIAASTGTSKTTVQRELSAEPGGPFGPPASPDRTAVPSEPVKVTGTDGKTYPRADASPRSRTPNFTNKFTPVREALRGVDKAVERFDKLAADPQFGRWLVSSKSRVDTVLREIAKAIKALEGLAEKVRQLAETAVHPEPSE